MNIQLRTDNNVQHDDSVVRHVEAMVEQHLGRYGEQLTRVEVHVSDTNAGKGGERDKHCVMEARLEGRPPVAASEDAGELALAITGAAKKLRRALGHSLGKLGH